MKKRSVMLDGMLVGTRLSALKQADMKALRKLMVAYGCTELGGQDIEIAIERKSTVKLSLRRHKMNKDEWFLNLSGNPLTFFKGDNTYGYVEADEMIVRCYEACVARLERFGEFPKRVKKMIADKDINLNQLEFACYTSAVPDKAQLLNDWAHMYRHSYSTADGKEHKGLLDLLDLKFERKHKKHVSDVGLKILSRDGSEEVAMLRVYDKAAERRSKDLEVARGIENRLRIDLNLSYGWFRRHSIMGQKIKTLRDLVAYVEKGGDWIDFIRREIAWALDRTKLFEMWTFDIEAVQNGKHRARMPEVYLAMAHQRANLRVTDEALLRERMGKPKLAQKQRVLNPHPYKLLVDLE